MDRPALRRVLLDLIGTARQPQLRELGEAGWAELDRIAALHRLQPLLFAQHRKNACIPSGVREGWQAVHRYQSLLAMVQQAELAETCALLEDGGFAPIALKGAWLAGRAYPDAALRPMRDIDLLVVPEQVVSAFDLLIDSGYVQSGTGEMALADVIRLDKHLPPLTAPRGTIIELHQHLWERDGRLDHSSPTADEAVLRARAVRDETGRRFLAPQDLLAHLIVHAIYSHRLDCGPLVLADIDYLLASAPIDWPRFWTDAQAQGWRDGARLVLELTAQYRPNPAIDFAADSGPPAPPELLDSAPDLLLQELETRASAGLAAAVMKQGPGRLAARITGRRKVAGEALAVRRMDDAGGLLGWAGSRTLRSLRDLAQADVRRQSRQLAALSKWLDR